MNHAGGHHRNGKGMNGPCWHLAQSWQQLAHEASYSVSALANSCGVSARILERLFLRVAGQPAERWLKSLRMRRALELLRDGSTVHDIAACLAYEDTRRFLQDFREHYGFCPGPTNDGPA
jgi:transcriptional regulator GlxA family with amidase domain